MALISSPTTHLQSFNPSRSRWNFNTTNFSISKSIFLGIRIHGGDSIVAWPGSHRRRLAAAARASVEPLDLTEENVRQVLIDARSELGQIFDTSVGITGEVDLADLDGPYVKLRLKGRFWHERSMVLARLGTYLKNRIPVSRLLESTVIHQDHHDGS